MTEEDYEPMGRPVYMKFKVEAVQPCNEGYTIYCRNAITGYFEFWCEEDAPEAGTEFEVMIKWPEDSEEQ